MIAPEGEPYRDVWRVLGTKAFQPQKTEPIKDFVVELQMVASALLLGLHAAEPHAYPGIQAVKCLAAREEPRRKVESGTPNHSVELLHQGFVEVMLSAGQIPNLIFKFLQRLGPHASPTAGEDKPQKRVALSIGGHFRFLRTQLKLEPLLENLLHISQCLFGLNWS